MSNPWRGKKDWGSSSGGAGRGRRPGGQSGNDGSGQSGSQNPNQPGQQRDGSAGQQQQQRDRGHATDNPRGSGHQQYGSRPPRGRGQGHQGGQGHLGGQGRQGGQGHRGGQGYQGGQEQHRHASPGPSGGFAQGGYSGQGQPRQFAPRGPAQVMTFHSGRLHHEESVTSQLGWLKTNPNDQRGYFTSESKDLCQLPFQNGQAKNANDRIVVKVNHFKATINLPPKLYHYVVDMKWENPSEQAEGLAQGAPRQRNREVRRFMLYDVYNFLITGVNIDGKGLKNFIGIKDTYFQNSGRKKTTGAVTDYSNALYTTQRLEDHVQMTIRIPEEGPFPERQGSNSYIVVTIKSTDEIIDTEPLQKLVNERRGINLDSYPQLKQIEKVYSAVLKNLMTQRYTPVGRSNLILFEGHGSRLGGGIVNYSGYNAILPICNGWKPYLNIDIANVATVMGKNVLDVIIDVCESDRVRQFDVTDVYKIPEESYWKASGVLRTCRVQYSPQKGRFLSGVVERLSDKSVSDVTFDYKESPAAKGRKISVYDYYKEKYGLVLKHKNGPIVELKGQKFIPAELCVVKKGQSYNRKLDGNQTNEMLKCAKKDPQVLENLVLGANDQLDFKNNSVLKDFGISFEQNLLELPETRVLEPPQLCFGKEVGKPVGSPRILIKPQDGTWNVPGEFQNPCAVKTWGIVNLGGAYPNSMWNFAGLLQQQAPLFGINLAKPQEVISERVSDYNRDRDRNIGSIKRALQKFTNCTFVLVVIGQKGGVVYNHVKQVAELDLGILTQCIIRKNLEDDRRNRAIAGNILLKINSKLNGINYTIQPIPQMVESFKIMRHPVLIIGADVTHPPPGLNKDEALHPSYAAVTGSIDRSGMPFMMHVQAQEKADRGAAEVIQGLDFIIRRFIQTFESRTKTKPAKIVYFRDGVGDGQFKEVLHVEMSAIRKACTAIQNGYEPKITIITVQKRHKTRIFLKRKDGRVDNAPPGTVVDTEIVHPTENDFFLLSHKGMLGTSRPIRYHVLWDDSNFTSDEIQTLAYYLCYMYVRCSKSVKIPAPTYYAHWAAARAKSLADGKEFESIRAVNDWLNNRLPFEQRFPMHFV